MNLKSLRLQKGLTQKDIANKLGITQFTYSNYENEKTQPKIELLIKIAKFYNVSLDYLYSKETNIDIIKKQEKTNVRLKELRESKKLSQAELAKKLKLTQGTYSNYETLTTQPDIKTLLKIADFYEVSLDFLCGHKTNNVLFLNDYPQIIKDCINEIKTLERDKVKMILAFIKSLNIIDVFYKEYYETKRT